jgi:hypothetical protein
MTTQPPKWFFTALATFGSLLTPSEERAARKAAEAEVARLRAEIELLKKVAE